MQLSIIVPYHNSEAWIGALLEDLLDQDLPHAEYEIVVVDDGSTASPETLKHYAERYPNVLYVWQENAGVSAARNKGLKQSKGEWIFFCDSDDRVRRQSLGKMLDIARERGLDMLFWNLLRIGPDEDPVAKRADFEAITPTQTGQDYLVNPPADFSPSVSRYIVRRELLVANRLQFREGMFYQEDSLFRLDVMFAARRVAHVDVDFYFYVQRPTSTLHKPKRQHYEQYAPWMAVYLENLTDRMADPAISPDLKERLRLWRDIDAFYMLKYLGLYASVAATRALLPRLRAIEALPLDIKGSPAMRLARRLMNRPRLWTATCRLIHLLPARIREQIN